MLKGKDPSNYRYKDRGFLYPTELDSETRNGESGRGLGNPRERAPGVWGRNKD